MGSETSSLRERIQGISKRPKAQKALIPLQEQVFVWRYLPAKQKIYPQRPQRLCGENPILDKHDKKYNNICALFREAVLTKSTVNNLSDGERNNFFFDSSLLKVSVDQFS